MRLDLTHLPVLMFRNSGSGALNVVYRRGDGHVGWIDPARPDQHHTRDTAPRPRPGRPRRRPVRRMAAAAPDQLLATWMPRSTRRPVLADGSRYAPEWTSRLHLVLADRGGGQLRVRRGADRRAVGRMDREGQRRRSAPPGGYRRSPPRRAARSRGSDRLRSELALKKAAARLGRRHRSVMVILLPGAASTGPRRDAGASPGITPRLVRPSDSGSAMPPTTGTAAAPLPRAGDLDGLHPHLRQRPAQVDVQQAVVQPGALHLDALGQHEGALELPGGDAAMEEDRGPRFVLLPAADHQLVVLLRDLQVVHGEAGDGQGDAQPGLAGLLDVVGRIAVGVLLRPGRASARDGRSRGTAASRTPTDATWLEPPPCRSEAGMPRGPKAPAPNLAVVGRPLQGGARCKGESAGATSRRHADPADAAP